MDPQETQDTITGPYSKPNESSPRFVAQALHILEHPPSHDQGLDIVFKVEFVASTFGFCLHCSLDYFQRRTGYFELNNNKHFSNILFS
jgi:hypothetical protein